MNVAVVVEPHITTATSVVLRRLDLHLNEAMKDSDMDMEDHFAVSPKGEETTT